MRLGVDSKQTWQPLGSQLDSKGELLEIGLIFNKSKSLKRFFNDLKIFNAIGSCYRHVSSYRRARSWNSERSKTPTYLYVLYRSYAKYSRMDESEDKEGNWNNSCNGDPTENNTDDCLKRQVDDLKRDVESLKKKLHKAEFERDNALKNVANLKDQVKDLSRKLQGEKKKNVDNKRGSDGE